MSCRAEELADLPVLLGCPADDELLLVINAVGGTGEHGYALRAWAAIKACINGSILPYIGVVDRGQANDPVSGQSTFQNNLFIGLGATNGGEIQIVYAETLRSSFGDNKSFEFDSTTGEINLDYMGSGEVFVPGSSLYVDRNQ